MAITFGEQVLEAKIEVTSHSCESDDILAEVYHFLEREKRRISSHTHELLRAMSSIRQDDLEYPPARMSTEEVGAEALASCLFDSLPDLEEELDLPLNVVTKITVQWQGATGYRQF